MYIRRLTNYFLFGRAVGMCVCELRDCEGCGSTLKEIGGAEQRPWQRGMLHIVLFMRTL